MTKQDEIDMLARIIAGLPQGGYLESIFEVIQPGIETAIRNDFGFISWSDRVDEQREHKREVEALVAEKLKLQGEIRDLQRQARHLRSELDELTAILVRLHKAYVSPNRQSA
jgi:hypothetical protein